MKNLKGLTIRYNIICNGWNIEKQIPIRMKARTVCRWLVAESINHCDYFPDLIPSNFRLFHQLKKLFAGGHFLNGGRLKKRSPSDLIGMILSLRCNFEEQIVLTTGCGERKKTKQFQIFCWLRCHQRCQRNSRFLSKNYRFPTSCQFCFPRQKETL